MVQRLRNQSQAGLLLPLCWEEELEEEGEGRESEPRGNGQRYGWVGTKETAVAAQLELAQTCDSAKLLVGPPG